MEYDKKFSINTDALFEKVVYFCDIKTNIMKLGEFLEKFSHNNIVRLVYKNKGGNQCVLEDWDDVSMDHEMLEGKGKNRHYINNEVLGLTSIYFQPGETRYREAINIVIEELENQPMIEEVNDEIESYYEAVDDYDSTQYPPTKIIGHTFN